MREVFTFDDVLIVPKFSTIQSRKDVNLSSSQTRIPYMELPIISANMDSVTGHSMAKAMMTNGAQACLHRFENIQDNVNTLVNSRVGDTGLYMHPLVSVGVGYKELERAEALVYAGAITIVVDVAHGASMQVVKQVKAMRELFLGNTGIVVGNFASADSVKTFLEHVGDNIDGVKVGIGPGSACTTRIKTGIGYPQLSAVMEISNLLKNTEISIIADGGLKRSGDIAKALGAGAHMVMLGGMLAGTDETPGEIMCEVWDSLRGREEVISRSVFLSDPSRYGIKNSFKKYRGSASKESYTAQSKEASWRTAEGESFMVPYKGSVKDVLKDIEGGLRSAFSYVGASNLKEFHEKVEFVRVSNNTVAENGAHGDKK